MGLTGQSFPQETPHAGRGRLREGHPTLKGHEAQGIHTQAILSQGSALRSRRDLPSPTMATQRGTPRPSPRGSLQLPPQGSTWSLLFRPVLATPVHILCCGFTGLVCIPFHCPRDSSEVSMHPDRESAGGSFCRVSLPHARARKGLCSGSNCAGFLSPPGIFVSVGSAPLPPLTWTLHDRAEETPHERQRHRPFLPSCQPWAASSLLPFDQLLSTVFKDPSLSIAWTPRASLYHEGPGGLSEGASLQPGGQDMKALFSQGSNPWSPLYPTAPER